MIRIHRFISLKYFDQLAQHSIPLLGLAFFLCAFYGCIGGLYLAPADYQQGEAFRIIYVHVPSAFLSLLIYFITAVIAGIGLVFRVKLCDLFVPGSIALGSWFTFLALITGSLWGKPMWGAWWIWDARLTSELILLFLYLGVIALRTAIPNTYLATRASALLLILGLINLPIIHYSVYWWSTLHQGSTLRFFKPSLIDSNMLYPLLSMLAAFTLYYLLSICIYLRYRILQVKQMKKAS